MDARRSEVEEWRSGWNFKVMMQKRTSGGKKKKGTRDAPASSRSRTFFPSPPQGALTQSRMGLSVKDSESGEGSMVDEKGTERAMLFFSLSLSCGG